MSEAINLKGNFPQIWWKFSEFIEFSESDEINGAWNRVNLKILSLKCDLLVEYLRRSFVHMRIHPIESFWFLFITEFIEFRENHLWKTQMLSKFATFLLWGDKFNIFLLNVNNNDWMNAKGYLFKTISTNKLYGHILY